MSDSFWTYVFIVLIGLAGGLVFFGVAALVVFLAERAFFALRRLWRAVVKKKGDEAWVPAEEHEREAETTAALREEQLAAVDTLEHLDLEPNAERIEYPRQVVPEPSAPVTPEPEPEAVPVAQEQPAPETTVDEPEPEDVPAAPTVAEPVAVPVVGEPKPESEPESTSAPEPEAEKVEPEAKPRNRRLTGRFPRRQDANKADETVPVEPEATADDNTATQQPREALPDPLAELRARLGQRG